jgi:hypothetical protein
MTPQFAALGYDEATRIRFLNDLLRSTGTCGRIVLTRGIAVLSKREQSDIAWKVRAFDAFTQDNDPHGEHDFGAFTLDGREIFWKIDYYDPSMEFGSEDPSDDEKTFRVLTIMLAEEY